MTCHESITAPQQESEFFFFFSLPRRLALPNPMQGCFVPGQSGDRYRDASSSPGDSDVFLVLPLPLLVARSGRLFEDTSSRLLLNFFRVCGSRHHTYQVHATVASDTKKLGYSALRTYSATSTSIITTTPYSVLLVVLLRTCRPPGTIDWPQSSNTYSYTCTSWVAAYRLPD